MSTLIPSSGCNIWVSTYLDGFANVHGIVKSCLIEKLSMRKVKIFIVAILTVLLYSNVFLSKTHADRFIPSYLNYGGLDYIDGHGRSLLEHEYVFKYEGPSMSNWYLKPFISARNTYQQLGHTIEKHVHKSIGFLLDRCLNEGGPLYTSFRNYQDNTEDGTHKLAGYIIREVLLLNHVLIENYIDSGQNRPFPGLVYPSERVADHFRENTANYSGPTMGNGADCNRMASRWDLRAIELIIVPSRNAVDVVGRRVGWFLLTAYPK